MAKALINPRVIRARLQIKFGTLRKFEIARGLPDRSVSDVLRGRSIRRTEEAIARELGVELHKISPRYGFSESTNADDISVVALTHRLSAGTR